MESKIVKIKNLMIRVLSLRLVSQVSDSVGKNKLKGYIKAAMKK